MPVGTEFPRKAPGIEDEVVAFRRPTLEFDLRAAFHSLDVEHLRIDVARPSAFVQQVRQEVGGQVVGVGHLLGREEVGEVPIAPSPSFE